MYCKAYCISEWLLDKHGKVKLKDFTQKVKGKNVWKNLKTGFTKKKMQVDMVWKMENKR